MFAIDRMARAIRTKLAISRNLSALLPAAFGVTVSDVAEAARQRAEVLERLARMADIHGAAAALKSARRYELSEMARKCHRCPHKGKCARMLYAAASRPCARDVDFCPNSVEYAVLNTEGHTANLSQLCPTSGRVAAG